jgi:hypothetical protein
MGTVVSPWQVDEQREAMEGAAAASEAKEEAARERMVGRCRLTLSKPS